MNLKLATLALCAVPFTAWAEEVSVETYAGPVTTLLLPETVVALDLAAIDTLTALGIDVDGVPAFTPPAYLAPAMDGVQTVGSLFEPDFEALAVMAPDLIIAGGRSQRAVESLSEIAPTIDMTIWEDAIAQGRDRITAYGAIFNKEAEAAELVASYDAAIATAREAVAGKGSGLIILTNGGTVSAYGDDSRFGWIHLATGLPEAFPEVSAETHGESVSFEFIAEVNPDWLIVVDRAAAIGQEGEAAAVTLDNPLVAGTTAGQTGQIIYLDSAALYLASGGAQSVQIILGQITDAFTSAGS